jgi:hypothetical protein
MHGEFRLQRSLFSLVNAYYSFNCEMVRCQIGMAAGSSMPEISESPRDFGVNPLSGGERC